MKYVNGQNLDEIVLVAPLVGAWVEINNNTNIGQAVKEALNGMAVVADGYIIGYLQSKNMESRNQNGGLGIFEV